VRVPVDEEGPHYQRIAGQSLERLAALSDGIFAIVMTLLVLNLRVPVSHAAHTSRPLWDEGARQAERALSHSLADLGPHLLPYFMSFLTLGIFWMGQQTQLDQLVRSDRNLTWIHLAFLLGVGLMPFSTALLAEYITVRVALVVYWFNLFILGAVLFASLRYAQRAGLTAPEQTDATRAAMERRIVRYQALYLVAVALCVFSTYLSIALLVLLQLNSAIAPQIRPLDRL
jgi:uncharacterized membrane protein